MSFKRQRRKSLSIRIPTTQHGMKNNTAEVNQNMGSSQNSQLPTRQKQSGPPLSSALSEGQDPNHLIRQQNHQIEKGGKRRKQKKKKQHETGIHLNPDVGNTVEWVEMMRSCLDDLFSFLNKFATRL